MLFTLTISHILRINSLDKLPARLHCERITYIDHTLTKHIMDSLKRFSQIENESEIFSPKTALSQKIIKSEKR